MDYIQVGRIVNTYGIKGDLKVLSDTDFPEDRFAIGNQVLIVKGQEIINVTIDGSRSHKGSYLIHFKEFNNINQVEKYKTGLLAIRPDQQHELGDQAYYYHQIIGLKVVTNQGQELGHIKDILELGSNDVWVVKRKEVGKKDALLPYIDDVIKDVNLESGLVTVELMEGLIDDED